jgi:hypothetical protein
MKDFKITYNSVEYGLHFGMEFLEVFCNERGRSLSDLNYETDITKTENEKINIAKDLIYSFVKTYAGIRGEDIEINRFQEFGLLQAFTENEEAKKMWVESQSSNVPEPSETAKKKKS